MPKWRYAVLTVNSVQEGDKWTYPLIFQGPKGVEQDLGCRDKLEILNILGEQGWEIIQASMRNVGLFYNTLSYGQPYQSSGPMTMQLGSRSK